jgi:hypothetical protein
VQIDLIRTNDVTYQSENQATNTGVWNGSGCGGSFSEWIHCPGHIDFGTVSIGGAGNNPPTVSITSPANGATFTAPANITIAATASDSDGTVTQVEFYQGTTLLGVDSSSPYSFNLTARATDNGGASTTSTPVDITVTPAAPVTLLDDGFEVNFNAWTDGGATDWDRTTSQKVAGSYSAHAGSADNDLISDNLNTSGRSSITIEFWYRDDDIDDSDNVYLQLYNGSTYNNHVELGNSAEDTWHYYTTTITSAQYMRTNFRIKFEGTSIDSGENLWIDAVKVTAQ